MTVQTITIDKKKYLALNLANNNMNKKDEQYIYVLCGHYYFKKKL